MSSDTLQSAIASIRSGDKETGKLLLAELIRSDPGNETAWLWMSSTVDSDQHRRYCLERVLQTNPHNETARRGLEALSQLTSDVPDAQSALSTASQEDSQSPESIKVTAKASDRVSESGLPTPSATSIAGHETRENALQTIKKTWSGGLVGKLIIGCGGLIILSCLCAVPVIILGNLAGDPDDTANRAVALTELPTDIPAAAATDIPPPTSTPVPTDTPIPTETPTPVPTDTPILEPTATFEPTATPTPVPPPSEPTSTAPPPQGQAGVMINFIFYDGLVVRVEGDEYAEVTNVGPASVDMGGWQLNAGAPGQDFFFPGYVLQPGQSCQVYTNEVHPETCGLSFGSGQPVWNNSGDCGYLFDAGGALVSEYCY